MNKRYYPVCDLEKKYRKSKPIQAKLACISMLIGLLSTIFCYIGYTRIDEMNKIEIIRNNAEWLAIKSSDTRDPHSRDYYEEISDYAQIYGYGYYTRGDEAIQKLFSVMNSLKGFFNVLMIGIPIEMFIECIFVLSKRPIFSSASNCPILILFCLCFKYSRLNIGVNITLWLLIFISVLAIGILIGKNKDHNSKEVIEHLKSVQLICTDKGIKGVAFKPENRTSYDFDLDYDKIKNVLTSDISYKDGKFCNLHIMTENNSISLGIQDNKDACEYIKNHMGKHTTNASEHF